MRKSKLHRETETASNAVSRRELARRLKAMLTKKRADFAGQESAPAKTTERS